MVQFWRFGLVVVVCPETLVAIKSNLPTHSKDPHEPIFMAVETGLCEVVAEIVPLFPGDAVVTNQKTENLGCLFTSEMRHVLVFSWFEMEGKKIQLQEYDTEVL